MKTNLQIRCCGILMLFLAPSVFAGIQTNVLLNPGFESGVGAGIESWGSFGYGTNLRSSVISRTGSYSTRIEGVAAPSPYTGIYQAYPAKVGEVWHASVWVLKRSLEAVTGENRAVVSLSFLNEAKDDPPLHAFNSREITASDADDEWIPITIGGEAFFKETRYVQIALVVIRPTSEVNNVVFYFDDVQLGKIKPIQWKGRDWVVRHDVHLIQDNVFSSNCVWIDENDNLHLKEMEVNGQWLSPMIKLTQSLGYGEYRWYVNNRIDMNDPCLVHAMYTYEAPDDVNEIDVEITRAFTGSNIMQVHYTKFPSEPGYTANYPFSLTNELTTHRFIWTPDSIQWQSYYGHYPEPPNQESIIAERVYTGSSIPEDGHELSGMQIHRLNYVVPTDTQHTEMVVSDFEFVPDTGASVIAVKACSTNGETTLAMSWRSIVGRDYSLYYSTNHFGDDMEWQLYDEVNEVAGTGLTMMYTSQYENAKQMFYKLDVSKP